MAFYEISHYLSHKNFSLHSFKYIKVFPDFSIVIFNTYVTKNSLLSNFCCKTYKLRSRTPVMGGLIVDLLVKNTTASIFFTETNKLTVCV